MKKRGAKRVENDQGVHDVAKRLRPDHTMKNGSPHSHWTLMVLFLSLVLDLLGFTVILPLIPSLLEYYRRNDQVNVTTC